MNNRQHCYKDSNSCCFGGFLWMSILLILPILKIFGVISWGWWGVILGMVGVAMLLTILELVIFAIILFIALFWKI